MLRQLHSIPGLLAALLLIVLSISGAVLSVLPALKNASAPVVKELTVAELAESVTNNYSGVESIQRTLSGTITVYFSNDKGNGSAQFDPQTGKSIASMQSSAFIVWMKDLHRSLLLGDNGRALVGVSAALMLMLCFSGIWLFVSRHGGWKAIFAPLRGSLVHRLHCGFGRFVVLALLLTSLSGSYLSAVRFNLLPEGDAGFPDYPTQVDGGPAVAVGSLAALRQIKVTDLQELVFPYMGDPTDFFSLTTAQGRGYIDQVSGEMLAFQAHSIMYRVYEFIYKLHTGEGIWWLGLLLGAAALNLPVICITGVLIWWRRYSSLPKPTNNCSVKTADTVILVGSEGNQTWGFAMALHEQLILLGYQVHISAMNHLKNAYPKAQRLFILTSTYGDGEAPASAKLFMTKLAKFSANSKLNFAVLGFGDRQFPRFGQFAKDVNLALQAKGFSAQLPLALVDRQSAQEFNRWGREVGKYLNQELHLSYAPKRPATTVLELVERVDYGIAVQAATTIFRFQLPKQTATSIFKRLIGTRLPSFSAGDLVGIFAPSSNVARFYSLASSSNDGMLEICVRRQEGGVCSCYLHQLVLGDCIEAFIKPNRAFRPKPGKTPIILIGAGTGIGPLIGFIRQNSTCRPVYLYWGGRHPQSDFLYQTELQNYLAEQQVTELNIAFSRINNGCYVQDKLLAQGEKISLLIDQGAQLLICGGHGMASSVKVAIDEILQPTGRSVEMLKAQGRYLEDVY